MKRYHLILIYIIVIVCTGCSQSNSTSAAKKNQKSLETSPIIIRSPTGDYPTPTPTDPGPSTEGVIPINSQFPFSTSIPRLISKQGIGEARMNMSEAEFNQRYSKLRSMGASYRQYNLWWSGLESSGLSSSPTPIACPPRFQLIPANATEKIAMGYKRYRCVNTEVLNTFDNLFKRDYDNGMQSGVVLWSSPPVYRYSKCEGFAFGGNHLKDGCVPRDDAMDDFEDYVNLVASRYNGEARGKISHFIIWNENATSQWFDYTPIVPKRSATVAYFNMRIDKYADMMKRAHAALLRHQKQALLYASTDQVWERGKHPDHMGSRYLIDGLWARLGTSYSWSIAVHPYGAVDKQAKYGVYTFDNLDMVVQYQVSKLLSYGVQNPYTYPQTMIIASEQGWALPTAAGRTGLIGRENQARQICLAHDKAMAIPQLTAVAHNYFHSVEPAEMEVNGQSGQGAFYGLVPYSIPNSLEGMESTSTGKAFASTLNSSLWKQQDDHFCCQVYKLGCRINFGNVPSIEEAHQVLGNVDSLSSIKNVPTVVGWACTHGMDSPIAVHLYAGGAAGSGKLVGSYEANIPSEPSVAKSCGTQATAYRFQIPLTSSITSLYGGQRIYIHGISTLGFSNNLLSNSGNFYIPNPAVTSSPHKSLVKIPIYRFFKDGDHLMTSTLAEGENAKYKAEGFKFYMFEASNDFDLIPIYRCSQKNNHFFSTAANCEGTHVDGLIGHLLRTKIESAKEVYRFYSKSQEKHLITTDYNEGVSNGFTLESVLGYAL